MNRKLIYSIIEAGESPSFLALVYNRLMILIIFISLVPLTVRAQSFWTRTAELVSCTVFIIDYCLRWITEDYRRGRSDMKVFIRYPFTLGALFDLLSILPIIAYLNASLKAFKVYRLFAICRFMRIYRVYEPLQILIAVLRREASILMTVAGFAMIYICVTALFMFNVEQVNPETGAYFFDNYFEAVYWATCTLTTVGYGDIYPISDWGRIVSMISTLVGIIALPSGIITAGYMEEISHRKKP